MPLVTDSLLPRPLPISAPMTTPDLTDTDRDDLAPLPARGDRGRPLSAVAAGEAPQGAAGEDRPVARAGYYTAPPAEAAGHPSIVLAKKRLPAADVRPRRAALGAPRRRGAPARG